MLDSLMLAADPVGHVINHKFWVSDSGYWLWSAHVGNLILSGIIVVVVGLFVASRIMTGPESQGSARYVTKNPFAHMIEVICSYLRDETVRPLLGSRTDKFMPFLWTIFFFILVNNLLGMTPILDLVHLVSSDLKGEHASPIGGTATQNIWVTGALAVIAALVVNFAGVRELGVGGYLHHLTAGTPPFLWPLMIPLEIIGTIIKPVALMIRLFANMTAGHILLAVLFGFSATGIAMIKQGGMGAGVGGAITLGSAAGAIAIYFLELFVAFLQAFVFTFLTTVFISQLSHHDHDHEHEHDHGHGHEHAHA